MSADSDAPSPNPTLEMRIDLNVLEHLGLKMYTTMPAVISEYVANAWDAWATKVDIQVPDGPIDDDYEITIIDNGFGMTIDDVNEKFLVVGRNRRIDEGDDVTELDGEERKVMGRKGIGKLAGFGVADVINVWTCKDGEYIEFELDYSDMQRRASDDPMVKQDYEPTVIASGTAQEDDTNCTIVTLKQLKRQQAPRPQYIRQKLARRFGVIDDDFKVVVNEEPITADERNLKGRCQFVENLDGETIGPNDEYDIKEGWIGTLQNQVSEETGRGVVVMARGKLVQEPYTFGVGGGGSTAQQALQYMVGEVHANFLDDDETDLISTDRSKVVWDEPPASYLHEFMHDTISSFAGRWPNKRREKHMEEVQETESYQRYIQPLDEYERELADSFLGKLAEGEGYDDEILDDMASYVSSGVQQKAFSHLLRDIDDSDVADPKQLLELFDRYEVLDAMNTLKIVKGRVKAIQKFDRLVETNAKEVPTMHDFLGDNPWILDPHWDYLADEVTFRRMLEDRFPDEELDERNRRIDFVCLGDVSTLKIVEIKRPEVTIGKNELEQLKNYVDFARDLQGRDPVGEREVEGYIIGKTLADSRKAEREYKRVKDDRMYVRTYSNLRSRAKQSHREFLDVIQRKAERTESEMLQSFIDDVDVPTVDEQEQAT